MAITALPDPPSRSDQPADFITKADAFIAALPTFVTEANAQAAALTLNSTTDTSSTSNSIGTGAKTFTVSSGKSFQPGMALVIADTAAPSTNYMNVVITSYSGTTLIVDSKTIAGSGTKTAWTISQSGNLAIPDNAVTTSKILDANVTHDKLATALRKQFNRVQDFRLSLTTALPVTTSDVTGATTIYCVPYKGNAIALYDGTNWNIRTSAEFSLALGTLVSGKAYDVFCYDNAGVPTLEFLVWTNDTTRATALVYQDGILVKSGATTRRYLGTFYTTATTTTEDSAANRYLYNYYNRVARNMKRRETAATWTYALAVFRQANANTANQLNFIQGVAEDEVKSHLKVTATNGSASQAIIAIGLDSTTTPAESQSEFGTGGTAQAQNTNYNFLPTPGKHSLVWLEYSLAVGTNTFYGTGNPGAVFSAEVFS